MNSPVAAAAAIEAAVVAALGKSKCFKLIRTHGRSILCVGLSQTKTEFGLMARVLVT